MLKYVHRSRYFKLFEVDGVEHVPHFLSSKDGLKTLVLDVGEEGVLATGLHLMSPVKVSD